MNARKQKRMISSLMNVEERRFKHEKSYRRTATLDLLVSLLIVVIFTFAVRTFITEPTRVQGQSMQPTLMDGERLFVEKLSYLFADPERGDIVICEYPDIYYDTYHAGEIFTGKTCVKRVIGLPGETVEVKGGRVFIDGKELDESAYWNGRIEGDYGPYTVPENSWFVMGDNRNDSTDSRYYMVEAIPKSRIIGRVHSVVLPLDSMRSVKLDDKAYSGENRR